MPSDIKFEWTVSLPQELEVCSTEALGKLDHIGYIRRAYDNESLLNELDDWVGPVWIATVTPGDGHIYWSRWFQYPYQARNFVQQKFAKTWHKWLKRKSA